MLSYTVVAEGLPGSVSKQAHSQTAWQYTCCLRGVSRSGTKRAVGQVSVERQFSKTSWNEAFAEGCPGYVPKDTFWGCISVFFGSLQPLWRILLGTTPSSPNENKSQPFAEGFPAPWDHRHDMRGTKSAWSSSSPRSSS